MVKRYLLITVLLLCGSVTMASHTGRAADPPVLTETQKLQIQNLAQQLEIAQLRAAAAQQQFTNAKDELTRLLTSLKVEGYDLDLQTFTYTKSPVKK